VVLKIGLSLLVLLVGVTTGAEDASCPPSLIVLPGATNINCRSFEGTIQVTYRLAVEYPADATIATLRRQLRMLGWLPLAEDFLNPGLSSSIVEGWSVFVDGTVHPEQMVHQWMADWIGLDGQVVRFGLRYSTPAGAKSLNDLHVAGILTPAAMAKADLAESLKRLCAN
jgi:hypothetical protein